MPQTLRHSLRWLSGVRSRLLEARGPHDVSRALGDALVPLLADELTILARDGGHALGGIGEDGPPSVALPAHVWESAPASTIWLYPGPDGADEGVGWAPVDLDRVEEAPTGWRIALPLVIGDEPAMVVLDRATARAPWPARELMLVHEAVRLAASALTWVEQQRRALAARAAADAAAHRWAEFARLSRRLARSVVLEDVVTAILGAVVPYLADWALLDVVDPAGTVERAAYRHALPEGEASLESLAGFPFGVEAKDEAIARLGAAGWLISKAGPEDLARLAGEGEHDALAALSPRSVAVVPLVAGKQTLGALTLATAGSGQRYEPGDLALFRSLAHQAALALRSARLYQSAERARMEREEMIAIVSHDLKNPLNTLGFALAILGQEDLPEEKKAPQYAIMQRSLRQMEELVNNLLDAARIDAGRFSVSPVRLEAGPLAREALMRAEPLAGQAGVRLVAEALDDLPPILADRGRLMQVFANLLDNAISFTPPGGSVYLRASAGEDALRFEVEDTGPGLDPEAAGHVFDRFWRARDSGHAGAGLGLAIALGIVEAHGGTIGVHSESGRGAVFHFSVPRAAPHDAGPPAPHASDGAPTHQP